MKLSFILPNASCWIKPYVDKHIADLNKSHDVKLYYGVKKLRKGDIAFYLSYDKVVNKKILDKNTHNIVVHESDLPKGKGWSPLTWQVLEGKNRIPIVLFEATENVDSGLIYIKDYLVFKGHELIDELREKQALKTIAMINKFLKSYSTIRGSLQKGKANYYRRRVPADSRVPMNRSIKEIFNLLRVADNQRYPVYFDHKGHTYTLKVNKQNGKRSKG